MNLLENGNDLAIDLSENFYRTSLLAFLETAGFSVALPVLRPISEGFGRLSAQGQIRGIKPSKLDEIVSYQCFMKEILFEARARAEMHERGAKVYVSSCKLQGQYPEICFLCCNVMSGACTEVMNPDYVHHLVKSLSSGDAECEWNIKKRGGVIRDLGERVPFERLLPEEYEIKAVQSWIPRIYVESWILTTEAFVETVGEDKALTALQRYIYSLGIEKGEEYASALGIEDSYIDSAGHVAKRVLDFLTINGIDASESDESKDKALFYPFSMSSPAIFMQIEAFCSGILESINPDYDPAYDGTTNGDQVGGRAR